MIRSCRIIRAIITYLRNVYTVLYYRLPIYNNKRETRSVGKKEGVVLRLGVSPSP